MAVTKNVRKLSSESANELLSIDIAERDARGRKIVDTYATKGEIPTSLPADGGNASYATTAGNAEKCNNHTLGCDVPANAVFTDTWPTAYATGASKSGHTLTITLNTGGSVSFTDTTYSNATTSSAGLMSSSDKTKLNGIESGAEKNKIKEIQVNGTTVAPDANGVVNIQPSGGGTTKYTHNITASWSTGSGSTYRGGTISFQFEDTTSSNYSQNNVTSNTLVNFILTHCGIDGSSGEKSYPINAIMQIYDNSSKLCYIANRIMNSYSSLYIVGFFRNSSGFGYESGGSYIWSFLPEGVSVIKIEDIVH